MNVDGRVSAMSVSSDTSKETSQSLITTAHVEILTPMIQLGGICKDLRLKYKNLQETVKLMFAENSSPLNDIEKLLNLHEESSMLLKKLKQQTMTILQFADSDTNLRASLANDTFIRQNSDKNSSKF
jgi:hypothetical protein